MQKIIKLFVFTVLILTISAAAIHADSIDTGWKGYGLYNLNKSEIEIFDETNTVVINGGNVAAVYEYTIKCNSVKSITINFGYPDNGIYKFSIHDGSKYLKYWTRDSSYVKNTYRSENLQTPEGRWYLFNMAFSPSQTRTIKVTIEAEMKKEDNDTYPLNFYKDRNYSYAISGKNTKFALKIADFKPYNIFETVGREEEKISDEGIVELSYSNNFGSGISIRYQPVDKMVLDKLSASRYAKPKAIAKAFNAKNYNEASKLCNEYINAPSDGKLNIEQVEYVKAECARLLNNNEEYLSTVKQMNIAKLYPSRIRYKVLIDKIGVYDAMGNDEGINTILKELIPEIRYSYPYLQHWLNENGYKLKESEQETVDIGIHPDNPAKASKGFDVLGALILVLTNAQGSRWTYAALGFFTGFVIGRITKRKKKKKSVYLFRD